ncbi:MAG TPA: hypothetical protein VFM18_10255 [Methanosarcina sp.]|nr:hypothetical protein [Methanosarcina sp.]
MALTIPDDQVSVRGVRRSSIAGVTVKPQAFQYQPTINQKRIETFDSDGFRIPGIPVPIAKDPKFTVGYNVVSSQLVNLVTTGVDEFYVANIAFATTDDNTLTFAATKLVIDGQSLSIDPLQDTMQIGFVCTDPSTVTFEAE